MQREISEWNTSDLSKWLMDNKYPGISELCQNNSISGYDLFYITDDILKNELQLNSFHERKVTMKLIKKLIYEHLKLNIINSNGDNVILTLDNNPNTSLGELSEYIGGMFNINPKDILYKDSSKTEVLSPSIKIVELLILYPRIYKTLNVFNMKDYHQSSDNDMNDNLESKDNEYNVIKEGNDSEFERQERINNNNKNIKMNFDYKIERNDLLDENIKNNNEKIKNNNKEIIYNEEYDIRNKNEEKKYYRRDKNINEENTDDNYNEENDEFNNNKNMKYKTRGNYDNNNNNEEYIRPIDNNNNNNKGYNTYRNRKNMNFNFLGVKPYQENNVKQYKNNYEKNDNYYDNYRD